MSENIPAFPVHPEVRDDEPHAKMTLRDYFAGQAIAGLFNHIGWIATHDGDGDELAKRAYDVADAMLSARAHPRPTEPAEQGEA